MRDLTEEQLTEAVLARLEGAQDQRFKQVMTGLIRHLHRFVREVELTEAEWLAAIEFLTATGQKCDDKRQEFILLSDTLGVSMLVDAVNHHRPPGTTENTVLGPFHLPGAPELPNGADISAGIAGDAVEVHGRVLSQDTRPIAGAILDVWQVRPDGLYDVQDPEAAEMQLRGKFRTDAEGCYRFRTVKPVSYPIPADGPVGTMLHAMGRHPYRPAHIHVIVSAPGYETVVTHLFAADDPYLDSDAVFAVKSSLVVEFKRDDSPSETGEAEPRAPSYTVSYDFGMNPTAGGR